MDDEPLPRGMDTAWQCEAEKKYIYAWLVPHRLVVAVNGRTPKGCGGDPPPGGKRGWAKGGTKRAQKNGCSLAVFFAPTDYAL